MAHFKRGNLQLKTNQEIQLGDSQETLIKYDGSNLLLKPSSGSLELYNADTKVAETISTGLRAGVATFDIKTSGGEDGITINDNGSVEIFYNNGKVFETTADGITVTGDIEIDATPSSDLTGAGDVIPVTVETNTQGIGGVLTIDSTTGNWIDSDYSTEETIGILAMAKETGTGTKRVMLRGIMRDDSWAWTPNDQLFVGTNGQIVNSPPNVEGEFIQVVGYALTATTIYFNPSPNYAEVGP